MYFPVGWPKSLNLSLPGENTPINHISYDAVRILLAAVGDDFIGIWYANPLIPIAFHRRNAKSIADHGINKIIVWKPDSRNLAVLTDKKVLLLYYIDYDEHGSSILLQKDPPSVSLQRDSAELFIKENIPRLNFRVVNNMLFGITAICCISLTEVILATDNCELIRLAWTDLILDRKNNNDLQYHNKINLTNLPFYMNHNSHLQQKTATTLSGESFVATIEYSPFVGGCAIVFNDNRAAFLLSAHLRLDDGKIHGIWVPDVEDATVCNVNHKFRLLAYGRHNSDVVVFGLEDTTSTLEFSHRLLHNCSISSANLGSVTEIKWSPDGCVIAVAWKNGGIAVWSTFGTLLMSSLSWDFGLLVDLAHFNPLLVNKLEWSTEGYQLLMTCSKSEQEKFSSRSNVLQLNFVKSTLTMNPCMALYTHVLLQGDSALFLNQGNNLQKMYSGSKFSFPNSGSGLDKSSSQHDNVEIKQSVDIYSILSESKYWNVLQLPLTYAATNWPIRYSATDADGVHIAVAGRTGVAHYSMITKKWKVFGNESQEKDFVVCGGLCWWNGFVIMGCYSLLSQTDEIRCYPEESKLDNQFGNIFQVRAPIIQLNTFRDQLIVLTADGIVSLFKMTKTGPLTINIECAYEVDVKNICIHPACIVSLTVTNLRNDAAAKTSSTSSVSSENAQTIILNVCGRILMIQCDLKNNVVNSLMASCLASCVECFWLSDEIEKGPMQDCLWLYSGAHGMRVWLPIFPPNKVRSDATSYRQHTFMSKRIMLSFPFKMYPLVILFGNVIVLGVENDTTLYTTVSNSHFSLPFSLLEGKTQVYLHKVLRQLIKLNLGYNAWEIAKSCKFLPYFPHSLELLLHEVLEEEATSKEPIPDALLPSVLDLIREFPVYLQTIVQCARKTEIALWPYLFSVAGKPKDLFEQCMQSGDLDTAASYLIIIQNMEPSVVSKQYATLLLDIALKNRKWELARDLIRFLKAIDPNEVDSPRSSMVINVKIAPPSQSQTQVNQNPEAFKMLLGPIARERSFSVTVTSNMLKDKREKSVVPSSSTCTNNSPPCPGNAAVTLRSNVTQRRNSDRKNSTEKKETFCIEEILQRHARTLLQQCKLIDLGYMSAYLDFHLVKWLSLEANKSAKLENFATTLANLHEELQLPSPMSKDCTDDKGHLLVPDLSHKQLLLDNHNHSRMNFPQASNHTSESGYASLTLLDTPTNESIRRRISPIKENSEIHCSPLSTENDILMDPIENSNVPFDSPRYCSIYNNTPTFQMGLDCLGSVDNKQRTLSEKISIKMRYLLQLFIEANCTDYAVILSILLQDAASIGRIINVVVRSGTLSSCERIKTALKQLSKTFDEECMYNSFMASLRPQIYILDKYTASNHLFAEGTYKNDLDYEISNQFVVARKENSCTTLDKEPHSAQFLKEYDSWSRNLVSQDHRISKQNSKRIENESSENIKVNNMSLIKTTNEERSSCKIM